MISRTNLPQNHSKNKDMQERVGPFIPVLSLDLCVLQIDIEFSYLVWYFKHASNTLSTLDRSKGQPRILCTHYNVHSILCSSNQRSWVKTQKGILSRFLWFALRMFHLLLSSKRSYHFHLRCIFFQSNIQSRIWNLSKKIGSRIPWHHDHALTLSDIRLWNSKVG